MAEEGMAEGDQSEGTGRKCRYNREDSGVENVERKKKKTWETKRDQKNERKKRSVDSKARLRCV